MSRQDYDADPVQASGTAAAPASNSTIASIAAQPAGWYELRAIVTINGAAELNGVNWRIKRNGATFGDYPSAGLGLPYEILIPAIYLDGTAVTTVGSGGSAATASTVYAASISLQRIG